MVQEQNPNFDVVFLDFYGTVADGDRLAVERTCEKVVADLGLPVLAHEFAITWGKVFFNKIETANHEHFLNLYDCECTSLVETLKQEFDLEADPVPFCDMLKDYWGTAPLHDDVYEALEALDVPVCCVSNADTEDIVKNCTLHGLRFDAVVTSEDVRAYKPDAAIFQRALEKMNVDPGRVLHVGDSLHSDVGGAKPLGIATAWLCREDRIFDTGEDVPDYKIHSLMELQKLTQD